MKRIITIIAIIGLTVSILAQAPQKISYQAVIRDANDNLVTNQAIGMQISILQSSASGTAIYLETHSVTTNANGLVTVEIGNGNTSGDFSSIDWSIGPYFIKTETDLAGGTDYTITSTSQLLSVPYALHAESAASVITETDPVYAANPASYITAEDITNLGNLSGINSGDQDISGIANNEQAIKDTASQIREDIPDVSGFITMELDDDPTNELQELTYTNGSLSITNGNSVPINQGLWNSNGNNIYYNNGLVGIGVTTPIASLDIYDNVGYQFLNFVSEDNVYTTWTSNRTGVDDYQVGIDGGNNRFMIANKTTGYFPIIIHGNNIGIGTYSPEAPIHITDFMKLEPRDTSPSSPTKGMIYYDNTDNKLKVYTGSAWENLN